MQKPLKKYIWVDETMHMVRVEVTQMIMTSEWARLALGRISNYKYIKALRPAIRKRLIFAFCGRRQKLQSSKHWNQPPRRLCPLRYGQARLSVTLKLMVLALVLGGNNYNPENHCDGVLTSLLLFPCSTGGDEGFQNKTSSYLDVLCYYSFCGPGSRIS